MVIHIKIEQKREKKINNNTATQRYENGEQEEDRKLTTTNK